MKDEFRAQGNSFGLDKKTFRIIVLLMLTVLIIGGVGGFVMKTNITINAPTNTVHDPYTKYSATIDASTILVGTGNFSLYLNLSSGGKTYSAQDGTIVYRPSLEDGEMYYEASSEDSGFEVKIFGADRERGQYAYQEYVCSHHVSSPTQFLGFTDKDEKEQTQFSCNNKEQKLALNPQTVYIFWGDVELDYKNGNKLIASDQNVIVLYANTSTPVIAKWQYGQGSYTTATLQTYNTVTCSVLEKQNYKQDEINPIGLGISEFNC